MHIIPYIHIYSDGGTLSNNLNEVPYFLPVDIQYLLVHSQKNDSWYFILWSSFRAVWDFVSAHNTLQFWLSCHICMCMAKNILFIGLIEVIWEEFMVGRSVDWSGRKFSHLLHLKIMLLVRELCSWCGLQCFLSARSDALNPKIVLKSDLPINSCKPACCNSFHLANMKHSPLHKWHRLQMFILF
jgi:hypothetical protein